MIVRRRADSAGRPRRFPARLRRRAGKTRGDRSGRHRPAAGGDGRFLNFEPARQSTACQSSSLATMMPAHGGLKSPYVYFVAWTKMGARHNWASELCNASCAVSLRRTLRPPVLTGGQCAALIAVTMMLLEDMTRDWSDSIWRTAGASSEKRGSLRLVAQDPASREPASSFMVPL